MRILNEAHRFTRVEARRNEEGTYAIDASFETDPEEVYFSGSATCGTHPAEREPEDPPFVLALCIDAACEKLAVSLLQEHSFPIVVELGDWHHWPYVVTFHVATADQAQLMQAELEKLEIML